MSMLFFRSRSSILRLSILYCRNSASASADYLIYDAYKKKYKADKSYIGFHDNLVIVIKYLQPHNAQSIIRTAKAIADIHKTTIFIY